jgi:hypothetical protein
METGVFSHFSLNPDLSAGVAMMRGMNMASSRYSSQANISSKVQPSGPPRGWQFEQGALVVAQDPRSHAP